MHDSLQNSFLPFCVGKTYFNGVLVSAHQVQVWGDWTCLIGVDFLPALFRLFPFIGLLAFPLLLSSLVLLLLVDSGSVVDMISSVELSHQIFAQNPFSRGKIYISPKIVDIWSQTITNNFLQCFCRVQTNVRYLLAVNPVIRWLKTMFSRNYAYFQSVNGDKRAWNWMT